MDTLRKKERGISLVESLASTLIFTSFAFGWLMVESKLVSTTSETQFMTRAVFIAETKIEALRQMPYDLLISSDGGEYYNSVGEQMDEPNLFGVDWVVTEHEANANLKRIELMVTWNVNMEINQALALNFVRAQ